MHFYIAQVVLGFSPLLHFVQMYIHPPRTRTTFEYTASFKLGLRCMGMENHQQDFRVFHTQWLKDKIGPSEVRALPFAAGINVSGHYCQAQPPASSQA